MNPQRPSLLVVADALETVQVLRNCLEPDIQVQRAPSLAAALVWLPQNRCDLLVLPLRVAEAENWTLLSHLRHQPCTCDLPLILLAPEVDETDRLCALQRGADELLRLPLQEVDLVRLRQHVIRSLRIKRLNACGATRDRKMQNATHDLRHQLMNLRLAVSLLEPAVGSDTAEQEVLASMETSLMKMEQVLSTLFPSTPRQLA